jgi:hypothetical protein
MNGSAGMSLPAERAPLSRPAGAARRTPATRAVTATHHRRWTHSIATEPDLVSVAETTLWDRMLQRIGPTTGMVPARCSARVRCSGRESIGRVKGLGRTTAISQSRAGNGSITETRQIARPPTGRQLATGHAWMCSTSATLSR